MKIPILRSLSSKTAKTVFAIAVLALTGVTACKKDSSSSSSPAVTEADAAQMTSDAVSSSTGGMSAQTSSSVTLYANTYAATSTNGCGTTKDTTISATYSGANYNFAYTLSWDYIESCDTHIATLNYTGSSNYSGLLTSISGSCVGEDVLTGIATSSTTYGLTGSFERKGNATSKVGQQKSFSSDLKISTSNALVDKTTDEITSGTATISLTGSTSGGKSFSFGGTLTFLGNKTGKLVLNSGTVYNITWE